ncbi:hypothetical protein LQL77_31330 [Rhodococcus cerastii]|nr:hypothetical protein [Rhodococcus cerastii]
MNLTRRHVRLVSTAAAGLSFLALGSGIASAAPAPAPSAAPAPSGAAPSVIAVRIDTPNSFDSYNDVASCDVDHPYLVLDQDANGHNENRMGRHATYHTGDGKNLGLFEHVMPGGGAYVPTSEYFGYALVGAHLTGSGGHGSITIYCASAPQVAHQK